MVARRTLLILLLTLTTCCCLCTANPSPRFDKRIGDVCFNHVNKEPGVCKLMSHCKQHFMSRGGIKTLDDMDDVCSFRGNEPIVCCPGRLAKQKCEEYSREGVEYVVPPVLLPGVRKPVPDSRCHIKPTFVTGGVNAERGEFPHMALIGFGEKKNVEWGCGGSLISDQYVLTAAHCLYKRISFNNSFAFVNASMVRLGSIYLNTVTRRRYNNNNNNGDVQIIAIEKPIKFPGYSRSTKYNDIALLKLKHTVKFTKYVRPACIHTGETIPNANYTITGWGQLNETSKPLSNILQKAKVDVFTTEECNEAYEAYLGNLKMGVQEQSMICAAGKTEATDTCRGDSGGPIQVKHPNATCIYSIVGVTSFGPQVCGVIGIPAVYTRISNYIDWIEKNVWM